MNNLHRELAPISDAAWAQIEEETKRTLKRYLAARRVVDVEGPGGVGLSAIGTGHLKTIAAPAEGVLARQREVRPLVELRVPFELDREQIDDVERGANDSDWQPAKDAAQKIAYAEDRAIFEGYAAAQIEGVRQGTSNPIMTLPADVRQYPDAIAQALEPASPRRRQRALFGRARRRRLYRPRRDQRQRLSRCSSTSRNWSTTRSSGPRPSTAPSCSPRAAAISTCISARTSRSAISRHDDSVVRLYLQETMTFLLLTSEASVALAPPATRPAT